jgi:hypothetical protein
MAINRVLFATQTVKLSMPAITGGSTGNYNVYLPAQSASADETIPQDDVLVMGKIDGVARLQKDVSTSKASVKAYIASAGTYNDSTHSAWPNLAYGNVGGFHTLLNDFEVSAVEGKAITVSCDSTGAVSTANDGFQMVGIISSIGIDASKGGFPTLDLAFEGIGRIDTLNMGAGATGTLSNAHGGINTIYSLEPLISTDVSLGKDADDGDTANSVKFSFDMPTETLSRMGGVIMGKHANVNSDNSIFSKPPYKASMTVDGQSLTKIEKVWSDAAVDTLQSVAAGSGGIGFELKKGTAAGTQIFVSHAGASVSARSFSQNVGDVGATFSVSAEGTGMTCISA